MSGEAEAQDIDLRKIGYTDLVILTEPYIFMTMYALPALANPNVLQPDTAVSVPPQPCPISIRCPHCRQLGLFQVPAPHAAVIYSKHQLDNKQPLPFGASLRVCPNTECRGIVLVVQSTSQIQTHPGVAVEVLPPQLLDFSIDNLPKTCQETLKEAIACHAAGAYRAAAMMVRRLLEEICDDNNATGANLHKRLDALKSLVVLPEALFDAMGELKALGNDAAHIEAKAYDNIGREEAEDSIELAREILKALYQLKGLVGRLQARKGTTPP